MSAPDTRHLYCGPSGGSFFAPKGRAGAGREWFHEPGARIHLTGSGRTAAWWAAQAMGLRPGQHILAPAYNGGAEIDPFLHAGLAVEMVDVDGDGRIRIDDLRRRIRSNTRAVLVVHTFGFPQALDAVGALCDDHDLWLIEDCAHQLPGSPACPAGSARGDVALYSLRKWVPSPDGGALILRHPDLSDPPPLPPPPDRRLSPPLLAWWLLERLQGTPLQPGITSIFLRLRDALRGSTPVEAGHPVAGPKERFHPYMMRMGMSGRTRRILAASDPREIGLRVRANYQAFMERLDGVDGIRILTGPLPDGVFPYLFAVEVDHREAVWRFLSRAGIVAMRFWRTYHPALSWREYPVACRLKDRVLALPIHSGLDERHVAYMAGQLRAGVRNAGGS
jgi:dTDP-4-amino-4,6-dideoxygalactose transaminase